MKGKAVFATFCGSWLLCGCSLERIFESPVNSAVTVLALIVAIASAVVIGSHEE